MSVIKLWAGSLISNTKNCRQRPTSFQHLSVFCQKVSWSSWVMLRSEDCKIAGSQAGRREETGCVVLGGLIRKHHKDVETPFLAGISERTQQLKVYLHQEVTLVQCGCRSCFSAAGFVCAVAWPGTGMHYPVLALLSFLFLPVSCVLTQDCSCRAGGKPKYRECAGAKLCRLLHLDQQSYITPPTQHEGLVEAASQSCGVYRGFPVRTRKLWESRGARHKILKEFSCG